MLQNPVALPGKCACCGASDNDDGRKYIDIGFELDFYGVIYFCTHCIGEIAAALGYISEGAWKSLEEDIKQYSDGKRVVEAENVKLRAALDSLDFLGTAGPTTETKLSTKLPAKPKRPADNKPAKPTNESGPADVSKTGDTEFADDIL